MDDLRSRGIIKYLQQKWNTRILTAWFLFALAVTVLLSAPILKWLPANWWAVPVVLIGLIVFLYLFVYKKIEEKDVAAFLNRSLPEVQESTGLLLKPYSELNFLEQFQVQKIEKELSENADQPASISKLFRLSFLLLIVAGIISIGLYFIPAHSAPESKRATATAVEIKPAQVKTSNIIITPPAYTGKRTRTQDRFNISAEEGGRVTWELTTTTAVKDVALLFNDRSVIKLTATDTGHMHWLANKQISNSGFYQVQIAAVKSELYRIEMVKDAYPSIVVRSPKPTSLIEAGQSRKTQLEVLMSDDYAIKTTAIDATIASGNGEAVKFKKQKLVFTDFSAGGKQYQLKKLIDLSALGMQPGDELYFYITATDSHEQEKRSDIYIVRIEDVTQLLSIEPLTNGLDIKPEFFRSQRQIIIETEQLLKSKDTMRLEDYNQKSKDLGIDQQLLRLRYGKFLGEETNIELGKGHDDHEEGGHAEASDFGNAEKMMDAVAHKHDNAEDASFFDPETKKQLKAVLDEMWRSELQLRLIKPKDALPFEYKALKLLKELQQSTRVYVAKTGTRTTPLKPEKRLTGELDKILQPVKQQNLPPNDEQAMVLRQALGSLEQLSNKETLSPASLSILEQAGIQLGNKAAEEPGIYLTAFESFRKILGANYKPADLSLTGAAFQKMINAVSRLPKQGSTAPDKKLSQQYFMHLNRANE